MFFADDPGALFRLQIGQARGGDTQGIFQVDEVAEIVIPVTAEPLVLRVKILRERPSPEPIPLYAAEFVDMLREEENMVCEAVFSLQFRHTAEM